MQTQPWLASVLSIVTITSAIGSAGCATLFKGASSDMKIQGLPYQASVTTPDGLAAERKEETVSLPAQNAPSYVVVKSLEGERKVRVQRFAGAGWLVLDVLGGFVPVVVDAVTGDWYEFDDTELAKAPLDPAPAPAPRASAASNAPTPPAASGPAHAL